MTRGLVVTIAALGAAVSPAHAAVNFEPKRDSASTNPFYSGGAGRDRISARNRRRERIDCGPGRDAAVVDRKDRVRRCERVRRR